jgi:hypothetical protein
MDLYDGLDTRPRAQDTHERLELRDINGLGRGGVKVIAFLILLSDPICGADLVLLIPSQVISIDEIAERDQFE